MQVVDVAERGRRGRAATTRRGRSRARAGCRRAPCRRRDVDRHGHGVGPVAHVDGHPFGHRGPALEVAERVAGAGGGRACGPWPRAPGCRAGSTSLRRASSHHSATSSATFSGNSAAQVVRLGDVLGDVVELPDVVVERRVGAQPVVVDRADRVEGHRLPAVVVDGTRPEHLEVLGDVAAGFALPAVRRARRRSWCRRGATARSRRSPRAARRRPARARSAGCRWRARTAGAGRHRCRPPAGGQSDDAGVGDAAFVDLALPALERRVARHGPAPRVVVVAERTADLVDAAVHLVDAGGPRSWTGGPR